MCAAYPTYAQRPRQQHELNIKWHSHTNSTQFKDFIPFYIWKKKYLIKILFTISICD